MMFLLFKFLFFIFNITVCIGAFSTNSYVNSEGEDVFSNKSFWYKQLVSLQGHGVLDKEEAERIMHNVTSPAEMRAVIERYSKYLDQGVLEKKELHKGWRIYDQPSMFKSGNINNFNDYFDNYTSLVPTYSILKKKLDVLTKFRRNWSIDLNYALILKVGDQHSDIQEINQWIYELGFTKDYLPHYFSRNHASLFAHIQKNMNVEANGQLTPDVLRFFLRTTIEHINKLKINMERIRWLPRQMPYPHIFVDIADFSVALVLSPNEEVRYRAIVGSKEHQTPIFQDEITGVVVNPSWSVPRRLARKALLEAEIREPGYLVRNGFEVYSGKGRNAVNLDPASIIWEDLKGKKFDLKIIQRPGVNNSLGLYKFHLSNPFDVYLHDTNKPNLYQYDYRAFSAGCVRVDDIDKLSQDLLTLSGQHNTDVKEIVDFQETYRVDLNKPIPVFFAYFTAWSDSQGGVKYRQDIYNLDYSLYNAMK